MGATLGIVGFGRIGKAVAKRAQGFGLKVLYCDPSAQPEWGATPAGSGYAAARGRFRVPARAADRQTRLI